MTTICRFAFMAIAGLVSGCAAPLMIAAVPATFAGSDLAVGSMQESVMQPVTAMLPATTEPSPVSGPLRCTQQSYSGGTRLHCVGGVPGHARWCNDLAMIMENAATGGFVRTWTGTRREDEIFERYCTQGEVPPEIARLQ